jgi:DNA topoisomerase I
MRLRRSDPDRQGLRRVRKGRGFSYVDHDGRTVDAGTRQRISALAIPPAWQAVWISPDENGHIQATGLDEAGRKQYLYHDQWRLDQDEAKHDRVLALARRLPRIRAAVEADLTSPGLNRERALATALRMLDSGAFRTGGDAYADEYGTHGVASLLRGHVRVRGAEVLFDFPAKEGVDRHVRLHDVSLAKAVTALRRTRHQSDRLLGYRDDLGWHEIHANQVNERFKQIAGKDDFTVKDLRTWQATVVAAITLGQIEPPRTMTALRRAEREAFEQAAQQLGNTPAVARRSYVDPRIINAMTKGRTIEDALQHTEPDALSDPGTRLALERAVIRLLSR